MLKQNINRTVFVFISIIFLVLGLSGVCRLHLRADVPFLWEKVGKKVFITNIKTDENLSTQEVAKGDQLLEIDDLPIETGREIEYVLDRGHALHKMFPCSSDAVMRTADWLSSSLMMQ